MQTTTPTEAEYLATRAKACIAKHGVSPHAHSAFCGCQRADTFCAVCDRDDFEFPSETLLFTGRQWVCRDCLDAMGDDL